MQWVGYAELASAVSNAGGLGIVCYGRCIRSVGLRADMGLIVDGFDTTDTG